MGLKNYNAYRMCFNFYKNNSKFHESMYIFSIYRLNFKLSIYRLVIITLQSFWIYSFYTREHIEST